MSMSEWAKKEVELACKQENANWDGESFDYGCNCYQSALKAFEVLMAAGHSFMSFGYTRNILSRLMEALPLTPITEDDFAEVEAMDKGGGTRTKQCPRMYALFQDTAEDGTVTYSDVERALGYEEGNSYGFSANYITKLVNELYPIKLPYYPPVGKYKVFVKTHMINDDEFDEVLVKYLITPEGERVDINRTYKFDNDKE